MAVDILNHSGSDLIQTPKELMDATIIKLNWLLKKLFPDLLVFGNGQFTITYGSTQVMVVVRPYTENDTCIEFTSHVVTGADITPELMSFMLRKNAELHFGAFGLLFDNTISYSHTIIGSNLNSDELYLAVSTVAVIADYYDDIIVDMAGGKRALDLHEEYEVN